MNPLISVLVPVYNVEEYLPRCLDSIVGQTYTNLEIILVNDGSTDRSGVICDEYAKEDCRVHVIHQHNLGVGRTRNTAVTAASGEYIMFVDADDYICCDAIRYMLCRLCSDSSDMVIGKHIEVYDDGTTDDSFCKWMKNGVLSREMSFSRMAGKESFWLGSWGKLYKADLIKTVVFPSLVCGEDTWVFPLIIEKCTSISVIDQVVYCYYQRKESLVHKRTWQSKRDDFEATLHVTKYFLEHDITHSALHWCKLSLHRAIELGNRPVALSLIEQYLSAEQIHLLLKELDIKEKIKYIAAHISPLYYMAYIIKKIKDTIT